MEAATEPLSFRPRLRDYILLEAWWRFRRTGGLFLLVSALVFAAVALILWSELPREKRIAGILAAALWLLFTALATILFALSCLVVVAPLASLRARRDPQLLAPRTVWLDDEGLRVRLEDQEARLPWADLRAAITPWHLVFAIPGRFVLVPNRAFPCRRQWERFVEQVRRHSRGG